MDSKTLKVAYIFLKDLDYSLPENYSLSISSQLEFSTKLPVVEESHWKEWMGSIKWKNIIEANAVIKANTISQEPDVLNDENKQLTEQCYWAWRSLQLTGALSLSNAHFCMGSLFDNSVNIRHWSEYNTWYYNRHRKFRDSITEENIHIWPKLFKQTIKMYSRVKEKHEFIRFHRGLWYFFRGCEERWLDFQLPDFVRCLEALIMPDKGKTMKQFKTRVNKWWPTNKNSEFFPADGVSALETIYDIRCDFDHLHGLKDDYSSEQYLIKYQAETTARNAYQQILLNDSELERFATDNKIKQYWNEYSQNKFGRHHT